MAIPSAAGRQPLFLGVIVMNCLCGWGPMHNFDDLNFYCERCGRIRYRNAPGRENFLIARGIPRCPVCGNVSVQNNGGWVCLACRAKYTGSQAVGWKIKPVDDIGRVLEINFPHRWHPPYHEREHPPVALAICTILLCVALLVSTAEFTWGAKAELYDVDFRSDPLLESVAQPQNLGNDTPLMTTISEWERDFGPGMINGTYWGTYFTGSKFEHFFSPVWYEDVTVIDQIEPNWTDIYNIDYGRYSYMLVSAHFNWSRQILMNGASEWWVRLPISPQSIECAHGLVMGIFNGLSTNASDVYLSTDFITNNTLMRPAIRGYMPQDYILYGFNFSMRGEPVYDPDALSPRHDFQTGIGIIGDDRIYLKVNSILKPNTDYIIALTWRMPKNFAQDKLFTYWSGMEELTDNRTHMVFSEFELDSQGSSVYDCWSMSEVGNISLDREMAMDWSFIFTEGIGADGLFGHKMTFYSNATLTTYPFFNTSRTGHQHMSFMLPFISNANVTVEPEVHQGVGTPRGYGPAFPHHVWGFNSSTEYEFDPSIWYNYTDFILFSTTENLTFGTGGYKFTNDDRWNVRVDYNFVGHGAGLNNTRFYNLTLLCYERAKPAMLWSSVDENASTPWNTSYFPWARAHLVGRDSTEYFCYEIWQSGRGTDGAWAMRVGTISGNPVYTFHFPQIIFINPMEFNLTCEGAREVIRISQRDGYYGQVQDWWGEHYYGEVIKYKFYNPMAKFQNVGGTITDRLSDMLDRMRMLGEWAYTIAVEFVGQLIKFVTEAVDAIVSIIMQVRYIVAPMIFMAIVAGSGRAIKKIITEEGGE